MEDGIVSISRIRRFLDEQKAREERVLLEQRMQSYEHYAQCYSRYHSMRELIKNFDELIATLTMDDED